MSDPNNDLVAALRLHAKEGGEKRGMEWQFGAESAADKACQWMMDKLMEAMARNVTTGEPLDLHYVSPAPGMGIPDNPYCNDSNCNDPNSRAMRWHAEVCENIRNGQAYNPEAVRLRDELRERAEFEAWAAAQSYRASNIDTARDSVVPEWYVSDTAALAWSAWQAALAATGKQQVGEVQGDALLESLVVRWRAEAAAAATSDNALCQKIANCTMRHATELKDALAARQPVGEATWGVLKIGNEGAFYDPKGTHRAFTYDRQPGNILASNLGRAVISAANASAGDSIDRGLALLKSLQEDGFGVFQIGECAAPPAQAVDLGQFRSIIEKWKNYVVSLQRSYEYAAGRPEHVDVTEANRLLAVIDGQAVHSEELGKFRDALSNLIQHVDAETCTHENKHRGGAIWTVCNECGMKWADDQGGFKPHVDAPAVAAARALASGKAVQHG